MVTTSRKGLPKLKNRASNLYLEYGHLEVTDGAVTFRNRLGDLAIPAATLACLQLGPGTTATHAALVALAQSDCLVQWVGEEGTRLYAWSKGTDSTLLLHKQVLAWANPVTKIAIARTLLRKRFAEEPPVDANENGLLAWEAERMRDAYRRFADTHEVEWKARDTEGPWEEQDAINRAISCANACLYGICGAAVAALGGSSGLGFLHTGHSLSFVFDVADRYKLELALPVAFQIVAESDDGVESRVRKSVREQIRHLKLQSRVIADLEELFL